MSVLLPIWMTARAASRRVREGIAARSFITHPEHCCWEPSEVEEGIIQVPLPRIKGLKERIDLVACHKSSVTAWWVSCFYRVSHLWTRAMYHDILSSEFWSQCIVLSPEAMWEVQFWKELALMIITVSLSGRLTPGYTSFPIQMQVTQDGGSCANVAGSWSEAQSRKSSTWREL